ncbi:Importin beta SMX1 [Spathaspora sp. JA1]|nr:Importin beta SMX1 [Spathaspora sp. JA1]
MDKGTLLKALSGTLDSNPQVRKQSEAELHTFEQQSGFTSYLLDLIIEVDISLGIKISAAIFFKNRVVNYWLQPENKPVSPVSIQDSEKSDIKSKLITTLFKSYKNTQIRIQLSTALNSILSCEKWDELTLVIKDLLKDVNDVDCVYTGLICVYEYTKNYRWAGLDSGNNPVLEEITQEIFPLLESLTTKLIESDDKLADEMLYLVIKTFKFATYSTLPSYFQDLSKLGQWCQIHILIINKPLPSAVLEEEDVDQRCLHPRIRTVKWCFANFHRLLSRHGGGVITKDKSDLNQFAVNFLNNFVPEILNVYWKVIEHWSQRTVWLSEASLFHLISFLEQLIDTPAWKLIQDKLEVLITHVLLTLLSASEETIELYQDEPEEYIRRFFDINRETNTSDVAAINFIYRITAKKFSSTINLVLNIINEVLTLRSNDRNNLSIAMKTEGAFRMLSAISYKLDIKSSPITGQVDKVLHTFVYPELLPESSSETPWLTARACDTIAIFNKHKYSDMAILQDIFQGIVTCFQNEQQFPIQLTAADALCTLVEEDLVAEHVSKQAPQLMENLLAKSKQFESDILTNVMDTFVQKFATDLEPFAVELASQLVEQFMRIASEILESQDGQVSEDKEYQASGILSTLTTLIIAMIHSPKVGLAIEPIVQNMVTLVLENAMVNFLTETIEILESLLFSSHQVSSTMWSIYQVVIESFDTYAFEYFSFFQPFFEGIINYGFNKNQELTMGTPYVQSFLTVCFNILKSPELDPLFAHSSFEDIELTILALNSRFVSFLPNFLPEIFGIFTNLEQENMFDGYMLHHLSILRVLFSSIYIDPISTIQFINSKQFLPSFYKLWLKHSDDFQSVYGCKLQILASLAIINSQAINLVPEDLVGETVDLLLSNIAALPHAIKAKNLILANESSTKEQPQQSEEDVDEYEEIDFEDDDLEAEEAELEAMKQTPIDEINVFQEFSNAFLNMQKLDSHKHQVLFGGIEQNRKELIENLIQITREHT